MAAAVVSLAGPAAMAARATAACSQAATAASHSPALLPPPQPAAARTTLATSAPALAGRPQQRRSVCARAMRQCVAMGIKAVESFDTSFELDPQAQEVLVYLLASETFLQQVAAQPGMPEGGKVEFTGELFQPVPWSPATKHGMPQELEKYVHDKDNYVIINVPPNFMFKAQIFKPSRLCAIYKKLPADS